MPCSLLQAKAQSKALFDMKEMPYTIQYWKKIRVRANCVGLKTIVPSPTVYGVWHAEGGGLVGGVYCAKGVQ